MEWIETFDELPLPGKYVIAKHKLGTWRDPDDQDNVNTVIVKRVVGISLNERAALPDSDDRKTLYKEGDEWGNNKLPYAWKPFGPGSFFGQDIVCWMPIPSR